MSDNEARLDRESLIALLQGKRVAVPLLNRLGETEAGHVYIDEAIPEDERRRLIDVITEDVPGRYKYGFLIDSAARETKDGPWGVPGTSAWAIIIASNADRIYVDPKTGQQPGVGDDLRDDKWVPLHKTSRETKRRIMRGWLERGYVPAVMHFDVPEKPEKPEDDLWRKKLMGRFESGPDYVWQNTAMALKGHAEAIDHTDAARWVLEFKTPEEVYATRYCMRSGAETGTTVRNGYELEDLYRWMVADGYDLPPLWDIKQKAHAADPTRMVKMREHTRKHPPPAPPVAVGAPDPAVATGADLDVLAERYGLRRIPTEDDRALRRRIVSMLAGLETLRTEKPMGTPHTGSMPSPFATASELRRIKVSKRPADEYGDIGDVMKKKDDGDIW